MSKYHDKSLGIVAMAQVRKFGGVLEHPEVSRLFRAVGARRKGRCSVTAQLLLQYPSEEVRLRATTPDPVWGIYLEWVACIPADRAEEYRRAIRAGEMVGPDGRPWPPVEVLS